MICPKAEYGSQGWEPISARYGDTLADDQTAIVTAGDEQFVYTYNAENGIPFASKVPTGASVRDAIVETRLLSGFYAAYRSESAHGAESVIIDDAGVLKAALKEPGFYQQFRDAQNLRDGIAAKEVGIGIGQRIVNNSVEFGQSIARLINPIAATLQHGQPVWQPFDESNASTIRQVGHRAGNWLMAASPVGIESLALKAGGWVIRAVTEAKIGYRIASKPVLRSPSELMGVEPASQELLMAVGSKRSLIIAQPGSEELRMLNYFGAEASVSGVNNSSILLRQNPSKAAVLEEFLHGTQARIGVVDRLGTSGYGSAETHVKNFMIRHQKMLDLSDEDVRILQILRDKGL